ncbi:hypothetical protein K450DRAFT_221207 [Umbelopsis ramanniana AG]|uniref:Uncharacterized protein n=1 Tax=Umbelopsis ramanniana AG TaxID=1314678 RepID=A0AAD5HIG5_UMBRA|nr:uncharacterized protein K450DRAFT_221207 [Umbelopsis ramanniana AG]KAI8584039.1 hypothetical protein K450DRAFT_221207 [Umbelopsis ramanniana AG]
MLPVELQLLVLDHLYLLDSNNSSHSITRGRLVCHTYYAHLTPKLFHTVSVSSPQRYTRLMQQLYNMSLVKCLDLSAYTTMGSGWTDAKAMTVVHAESLSMMIRSCSRLEQVLLGDGLGNVINDAVLNAIFSRPLLRGVDMMACSNPSFAQSFSLTMGNLEPVAENFSSEPRAFNQALPTDLVAEDDSNASVCSGLSRRNSLDCIPSSLDSDIEIRPVVALPDLESLSLHMCSSLSESLVLSPLLSRLPTLTHIDLSHTKITTATLWNIQPVNLKELSLRYCRGLTCCNAGLPYVLARFTDLEYLNLAMNPNLGGSRFCETCLLHIMSHLSPCLTTLDISGSLELNDDHLAAMKNTQNLEKLSIAYCRNVSLNAILALLKRSPNLHYLNVTGVLSVETTLPSLMKLLECTTSTVTEISDQVYNVLPGSVCGWTKSRLGRRCYLQRGNIATSAETTHSYKVQIDSHTTLSPIIKYWSYAV